MSNKQLIKIPRIALVKFDSDTSNTTLDLLKQIDISLRTVSKITELNDLVDEEKTKFDAILIDFQSEHSKQALAWAEEIKKSPLLSRTPLFGINDFQVISKENLILSGFDSFLKPDFKPEDLKLHIISLNRMIQSERKILSNNIHDSLKTNSLFTIFDLIGYNIFIFNEDKDCTFINESAIQLFRLNEKNLDSSLLQFIPYLKEHEIETKSNVQISSYNGILKKGNGLGFEAEIKIISFKDDQNDTIGYALHINSSIIEEKFEDILKITSKSAVTSINSLAYTYEMLRDSSSQTESWSTLIEKNLAKFSKTASLNDCLAMTILIVDEIIDPNTNININFTQDYTVGASEPDLFRILILLFIFSAKFVGSSGDITFNSESNGHKLTILVRAQSSDKHQTEVLVDPPNNLFLKEAKKILTSQNSELILRKRGQLEYDLEFVLPLI